MRTQSNKALLGLPQYWLTTSMYAGSHPEDSMLMLLDAAYFPATHIITAGTLVQIIDVKYNKKQFLVHLKAAKDRGQVSIFSDKHYVINIPEHIKSKDELKKYLTNFMTKKDPHEWILKARAYIQEGIWNKQPVIGMKKRDLLAAMGPPRKKQPQKNQETNSPQEIWHYLDYFVLVENNEVTKVKKLRDQMRIAKK